MTADKPSHLVPKLRFPKFRNAAGWTQTPLGDAFRTIMNGQANAQDHQGDGAYPLFDRSKVVKRSSTFLFDAEAVILPGEGMRFQPRYFNGKFNLHQRAYALMEPTLDPRFAFHALDRFKGALADSAVHSTVRSLRMPIIEKFAIPCPTSDDEQKKIADCLGSLDDLIAAEGRKLEALRQHKQGLMQQLFPQPGETMPRLRFPEFVDAPHWQTSTFGERCESFNGGTPNTSIGAYYGGTIPFIRSAEIGRNETELCLTEEGLENSAAKMVKRGELLVALYGANSGDTALARIGGAINQAIMCLRSRDSVPYLYHYLTARKNWIIATYLQGGQGNLSRQIVLSVPLSVPHRDEQKKVADSLSTLDARIEGQAQRIDTLLRHKQGLIQQLFPSPQGH